MALFNKKKTEIDAPVDTMPTLSNGGAVIGVDEIKKAQKALEDYRKGKKSLEDKIISNEQWYKMRHWDELKDGGNKDVEPASAWLFNSIVNKHADAMDNFPAPNILPREESDKDEAKMLTSIIPVILEQNKFEETYSRVQNYKLKNGVGVYGVFWDSSKLNGLGDISIKKIDILSLFWEPGVIDIQDSQNIFHVELVNNDDLIAMYPQLLDVIGSSTIDVAEYVHDDTVDTSHKTAVVDWYYKKIVNGKTVLHFVKYVNDVVLFATENEAEYADRGLYDHGRYPFEFDVLFPTEGTPVGFGYIDVGRSVQEYIDRGNKAIMENMLANSKPRYFFREDGGINEKEFLDLNTALVHADGSLGQDSVIPIESRPLGSVYLNILDRKIDELKETTGSRDVSTGGTISGVTSASGIAALQEASGKTSRDSNKASFRTFRNLCEVVIELIRQFYDMPRAFRITGQQGEYNFVTYRNMGIQPQYQGEEFGQDMGYRLPVFDIEVTAERKNPYSKMAQNDLALQFYGQGFFLPQNADQALACLDMMDFDRKDAIMQRVSQNGTLYQTAMQAQQIAIQMAQIVDSMQGTNYVGELSMQFSGQMQGGPSMTGASADAEQNDALGGKTNAEPVYTKKAREYVAEVATPA